jgi:hypothetical protein
MCFLKYSHLGIIYKGIFIPMFVYSAFSSMLLIVNTYPYTIIYVMEQI